jgi:hypothetical protein
LHRREVLIQQVYLKLASSNSNKIWERERERERRFGLKGDKKGTFQGWLIYASA